jgi:hypothetical protein
LKPPSIPAGGFPIKGTRQVRRHRLKAISETGRRFSPSQEQRSHCSDKTSPPL